MKKTPAEKQPVKKTPVEKTKPALPEERGRHLRSVRIWHEGANFYGFLSYSDDPFGMITDRVKVGPEPSASKVMKAIIE